MGRYVANTVGESLVPSALMDLFFFFFLLSTGVVAIMIADLVLDSCRYSEVANLVIRIMLKPRPCSYAGRECCP